MDKLQEAISLIKSGDRQNGQRLLSEVLKIDPGNELAWLWMSTLVAGDKKRFCLEKALSINPNNIQAKQQLAQLLPSQPPQVQIPLVQPAAPIPQNPPPFNMDPAIMPHPAVSSAMSQAALSPQIRLIPGKQLVTVIYLSKDTLFAFDVLPHLAPKVADEMRHGMLPRALYKERANYHLQSVCYVALEKITLVRFFSEQLTVTVFEGQGREKKYNITCDKANVEGVLKALQQGLGPRFQKSTRPISRFTVAMSGVILFLMVSCGTGFFYWFAQGLANEEKIIGSARTRGLANLIMLIGPNGFLCIGGVLFLVVIIAMISSFAKPPEETVLTQGIASKS